MLFQIDQEGDQIKVAVTPDDKMGKFNCRIVPCSDPVCTCTVIQLELYPDGNQGKTDGPPTPRIIPMDILEKKPVFPPEQEATAEEREFAEYFLSRLEDDDFYFLYKMLFAIKNEMTEEASPDSIVAHFEYDEIENEGSMAAYNNVLPFGDQLTIDHDKENYIIFDQYCLRPKCACTDAFLSVLDTKKIGGPDSSICTFAVNYLQKQWKEVERHSPLPAEQTLKAVMEEQLTDFYDLLRARHTRLKAIYANSKEKRPASRQSGAAPEVG